MSRKVGVQEGNISEGKQLINIGGQRREWIKKVAELSNSPINEVMRCLIDQASVEDPESYAVKIVKFKTRQRLEDIERRERELQEEKVRLVSELEKPGELARTGK